MISDFGLFWANETDITDFWMGPSVKIFSRINGSFPPKKIMGQIFSRKKGKPGGGPRGFVKRAQFFRFFSGPLPLPCCLLQFAQLIISGAMLEASVNVRLSSAKMSRHSISPEAPETSGLYYIFDCDNKRMKQGGD